MSGSGFCVETDTHKPTLRFAVAEALRTASLALRFDDAAVKVIRPGQITVIVPGSAFSLDELDAIVHLAGRKFAQVNDLAPAAVICLVRDES